MQFVRSILFYALFLLWTLVISLAGLPLLALPRRHMIRLGRIWCSGVLALLDRIAGITHEVRGPPPTGPVIVAAKHQSSWETFVLPVLLGNPAYVLKRELTLIPLLGRCFVKVGHIAVDRTAGGKALRSMIKDAKAIKAEGRPIVIFPEGTRTAAGSSGDYQAGVSALYLHLDLPVVPVALNSGLYWPRRTVLKRPGRIVIEFLEPILPGKDRESFMSTLHCRIEEATRRLVRAGETPARDDDAA